VAKQIKKEFTYDLPDDYLATTSVKGLKATGIYDGPDKIWVLVDNNTSLLQSGMHYREYDHKDPAGSEQMATLWGGMHSTPVLVDVNNSDIECVVAGFFLGLHEDTYTDLEHVHPEDGQVHYIRPDPTYPDHTYETGLVSYDLANKKWNTPFPWKQPHITAEQHDAGRLNIIADLARDLADEDTSSDWSAEKRKAVEDYKAQLEDIPRKFAGWQPWQIHFGDDPRRDTPAPAIGDTDGAEPQKKTTEVAPTTDTHRIIEADGTTTDGMHIDDYNKK
jgi:hypothetical protein